MFTGGQLTINSEMQVETKLPTWFGLHWTAATLQYGHARFTASRSAKVFSRKSAVKNAIRTRRSRSGHKKCVAVDLLYEFSLNFNSKLLFVPVCSGDTARTIIASLAISLRVGLEKVGLECPSQGY